MVWKILYAMTLVVILAATIFAFYGKTKIDDLGIDSQSDFEVSLPSNTVVVEQCVDMFGVGYAKPDEVISGPIYYVWKDEVVGYAYNIAGGSTINHDVPDALVKSVDLMFDKVTLLFISQEERNAIMCNG